MSFIQNIVISMKIIDLFFEFLFCEVRIMKTTVIYFVVRLALISLVIICYSCSSPVDDNLSSTRTDYTGNQLRLDGYYYYEYHAGNEDIMRVYFLYHNGVILKANTFDKSELGMNEEQFITAEFNARIKTNKYGWGLFLIDNNTIQFEHWYVPYQEGSYPAGVKIGEIINDTTFHISRGMRANGTEKAVFDETYHFKRFSPKPDSTNKFVK